MTIDERRTAAALETALGRRSFMAAVAAVTAGAAVPATAATVTTASWSRINERQVSA